jgi:hypothetical protein
VEQLKDLLPAKHDQRLILPHRIPSILSLFEKLFFLMEGYYSPVEMDLATITAMRLQYRECLLNRYPLKILHIIEIQFYPMLTFDSTFSLQL